MANPRDQIGTAKIHNWTNVPFFDLKTDKTGKEMTYCWRFMPPIRSCIERGAWCIYHRVHFGFDGLSDDGKRKRSRPFRCIEELDFKTKMVKKVCPVCDMIGQKTQELEELLTEKGEAAVAKIADMKTWLKDHNIDGKWYANVVDNTKVFGVGKFSNEVKKLLTAKMQEVQTRESIDPFHPDQGVYFEIKRNGYGSQVTTSVSILQEALKVDGRVSWLTKTVPLSDEQLDYLVNNMPDLNSVVRELSEDQIRLIANSSGDPAEIDEIWAMGTEAAETVKPPVTHKTVAMNRKTSSASVTESEDFGFPVSRSTQTAEKRSAAEAVIQDITSQIDTVIKTATTTPVQSEVNPQLAALLKLGLTPEQAVNVLSMQSAVVQYTSPPVTTGIEISATPAKTENIAGVEAQTAPANPENVAKVAQAAGLSRDKFFERFKSKS